MTTSASYFWTAPILPMFYNNEIIPNITSSEISWVVSIVAPGLVPGSLIASRIADSYGRRVSLLISAFPFIVGTVFILFATKTWMLYIGRLLWGVGTGMANTMSSPYLSEIADKDIRGSLTACTRFMFSLGELLVMSLGFFVTYEMLTSILIALPVCYFIACWLIPESPYFLLKEGKVAAAEKVLLKLSGLKDKKLVEERLTSMQSDVRRDMARSGSIKELLTGKQYRKAIIIVTGLRVTQLMTGTVPIQQYLGRIIQQSDSGMAISTALITFGIIRLAAGLALPLVVDRVGRRPLLMITYTIASVVLAIVGLYFFMQQVIGLEDEANNPFRFVVFGGIIIAMIAGVLGFNTLIFIIPSEVFPLNVKSIAMTLFNIFGALIVFIGIRGYQILEDYTGVYGVFWFYSSMALCGAVFTYFVVPETKGKTLGEIQIELQGNIIDEADEKLNKVEVVNDNVESQEQQDTTSLKAS
ncbi:facilitated trehalose transporter Tret1-like isoform X2 [Anticarsia gemmatalis]